MNIHSRLNYRLSHVCVFPYTIGGTWPCSWWWTHAAGRHRRSVVPSNQKGLSCQRERKEEERRLTYDYCQEFHNRGQELQVSELKQNWPSNLICSSQKQKTKMGIVQVNHNVRSSLYTSDHYLFIVIWSVFVDNQQIFLNKFLISPVLPPIYCWLFE